MILIGGLRCTRTFLLIRGPVLFSNGVWDGARKWGKIRGALVVSIPEC